MKKYVITTIVLVTVLVPPAFAVNSSLASDVAKLKRQMKTVQGQVAALSRTTTDLTGFANCIRSVPTVPANRYGQPSQGNGYVYADVPRDVAFLVTALDAADPGEPVSVRLATVNPSCVTASNGSSASSQQRKQRKVMALRGEGWSRVAP